VLIPKYQYSILLKDVGQYGKLRQKWYNMLTKTGIVLVHLFQLMGKNHLTDTREDHRMYVGRLEFLGVISVYKRVTLF
jgi:hypothetical protein